MQTSSNEPCLCSQTFPVSSWRIFNEIVLVGPLGRTKYYVIGIGLQGRGSKHIDLFLWIVDVPVLTEDTIELYTQWVDCITSAKLPDHNQKLWLYGLVKTYQLHKHSKAWKKYKNAPFRFCFGRSFSEKTIKPYN